MFGWFKKDTEPIEIIKEVVVPCTCETGNEHCDLILQLRKCQDLKREIKNEIEMLNRDSRELIQHFIWFLRELEKSGFKMNTFNYWISCDENMSVINRTINEYSSGDIFRMTEELRTYKNKEDIICEKQRALKAVEDDISKIKSKLGIE